MIAIVALLVAVIVVLMVVPIVRDAVMRSVSASRAPEVGSIDQELVEARLGRIEEAIDALALQVERLTEQQRALLESPDARQTPDPNREARP